jgi:hypothetical protein
MNAMNFLFLSARMPRMIPIKSAMLSIAVQASMISTLYPSSVIRFQSILSTGKPTRFESHTVWEVTVDMIKWFNDCICANVK